MPFDLTEKPVIEKRTLLDNLIFDLDMEKGRLSIEGVLEDKYDTGIVTKSRPRCLLRASDEGTEYLDALNELLPEIAVVPWQNPKKIFSDKLLEILARSIVK